MVSGRSIGSGPACHLASKFQLSCLILISPIKSVVDIAKQKYGRLAELFVNEHFNNMEKADKIVCPTIIIHGAQDNLVLFQDSIDMINDHLTNSMSHLFIRDQMNHNKFNHEADVIKPLMYVLDFHKINISGPMSTLNLIPRFSRKNLGLTKQFS